ncbi:MAG TPA: hypothetical protein VGW78_00320 [Candidatus Babeliales bacterium]|jgi:hypothetical protein|nr:hypothetical protein [Candidatus Babeliales bacterium]
MIWHVLFGALCCLHAISLFAMDVKDIIKVPCINGEFVEIKSDKLRIWPQLNNIEAWPEEDKKYLEAKTFNSLLQKLRGDNENFYSSRSPNIFTFTHDAGKMVKLSFLLSRGASRTTKLFSATSLINGYIVQKGYEKLTAGKGISEGSGHCITSIYHGDGEYYATAFGGLYKIRKQNNALETQTLFEPRDYRSLLTQETIGNLQELSTIDEYSEQLEKTIENAFACIQYRKLAADGWLLAAATYDHVDIFSENKKIRTWDFQSVSPILSMGITSEGLLCVIQKGDTQPILYCYKDFISSIKLLNNGICSPIIAHGWGITFDFLDKNDSKGVHRCTILNRLSNGEIKVHQKPDIIALDSEFRDNIHVLIPYLHQDNPTEKFTKNYEDIWAREGHPEPLDPKRLLVAAYLLRSIITKFGINFKPKACLQQKIMHRYCKSYKLGNTMHVSVYANGSVCFIDGNESRRLNNNIYAKYPKEYNIKNSVLDQAAKQNSTEPIDEALQKNINQFNVFTDKDSIYLTLPLSAMKTIVKKYRVSSNLSDPIVLVGTHEQDKECNVIAYGKDNNINLKCMDLLQEKYIKDTKGTEIIQQQMVFQGREIPLPAGIQCEPNIEYVNVPKYDADGRVYGNLDEPHLCVKKSSFLDYLLPRTVVFPLDHDKRLASICRPSYFNLLKPWVIASGICSWIKSKFGRQQQSTAAKVNA